MKQFLTSLFACACLAAGVAAAPASGPAPNYADRLDHRGAWHAFPIRVWFVHDDYYSERLEDIARDGFDAWAGATRGFVRYEMATSSSQAQIVVRFDPGTNDGRTNTWFHGGRIMRAEMRIGVRRGSAVDVESTAAHEFGHALGISGHSDDRRDLMYPVHMAGTPLHITVRDLNTLASRYPALAGRLAPPARRYRDDGFAVDARSTKVGATT